MRFNPVFRERNSSSHSAGVTLLSQPNQTWPRLQVGQLVVTAVIFWFMTLWLAAQPYGLEQRPVAGPFLNNALPEREQVTTGWQAVEAFPGITFDDPTCLTPEPRTNRLYVCGRQGVIHFFVNDLATTNKTLFLDLTAKTQGYQDSGLVGMAFHPDFGLPGSPNRGYIYVYYMYSPSPVTIPYPPGPDLNTAGYDRLSRFTVPDGALVADPNSEVVLINQYDRNMWHNGGGMFFGADGFLYLSIGDEGGINDPFQRAQQVNVGLFSGVLRLDVDMNPARSHAIRRQPQNVQAPPPGWPATYTQNYFIPNANPWLDAGGALLEEFYAVGFRSPHRMTYDPPSGRIWLGDVGQAAWEEVDLVEKGGNYQWAYLEGTHPGPAAKPNPIVGVDHPPVYEYPHTSGNNCVIGGYVYRGAEHAAFLSGQYIFGDNGSSRVWALADNGNAAPEVTELCVVPNGGPFYNGLSSFGLDQNGELYLCVMGPATKIYKLAPTGSQGAPPPPLLSQTGAFTNLATLTPSAALIPYTVNSPLWSDNAVKFRWMTVPNDGVPDTAGETVGFAPNGGWSFPIGSVLVKHFELPLDDANPALRKRLETRFLVRGTNGNFYGLTYKWRADNSEADLLPGSLDEAIQITTASGMRTQVWTYPSRQDCLTCHSLNANQVLGPRTCQMNGDYTYPATGVTDNQIRALNHIGLFTAPLNEVSIPGLPRTVPLSDTSATLEHRVRSYLDANCAHCHRPNGLQSALFDARFDTPLTQQGLVNGPVLNSLGITGAKVVAPQSLSQSLLHVRDNLTGLNQMPPLAKNLIDTNYIAVLAQWINSLPSLAPPLTMGNPAEGTLLDGIGAGWINAARFQATADLSATTLSAKVVAISGAYKAAIYSDSDGQPGPLLQTTAAVNNPSTGWRTFPLTAPQALTNGLFYWLAIWSDNVNAQIYYSGTTGTLGWQEYDYGNWPNPLVPTGSGNSQYCIYATGTGPVTAPMATNLAVTILEDTSTNLTLLGGGSAIGYAILNPPTNGVLLGFNPNSGAVTYAPDPNQNGGDTFLYRVSNGSQQATGTVSLTITAVNDAPVATDKNYELGGAAVLTVASPGVLNNASDIEADSLTAVLVNAPLQGALNLSADGAFSYTPTNHFQGVDLFTYQVNDGWFNSEAATVSIVVSNTIQMTSIAVFGDQVRLAWTAIAGKAYRLQYKDDLTDASWLDLVPDVNAAGATAQMTNTVSAVNRRFYRVLCPGN